MAEGIIRINDFDGDLSMELDLGEHMGSQIFWFGYYARDILSALRKLIRPGMTFLDVGANIGEVSLFAAKRVGKDGRVIAFEPIASICQSFRGNISANGFANVTLLEMGAADFVGEASIFVQPERFADGSHHRGLGTMYPSSSRNHLVDTIRVTTIDTVVAELGLSRIDIIKMDVEGAELAALRGAVGTIARFKPIIAMEIGEETCRSAGYAPGDALTLLASIGYRFAKIRRNGRLKPITARDLGYWQDVLCSPTSTKTR